MNKTVALMLLVSKS